MKMTIGKFKGQPVAAMATPYLFWLICNDNIRYRHWPLVRAALKVLRSRFDNLDAMLAELKTEAPPPEYWKTPARANERKQEKAEKLRQLEARRAEEAREHRMLGGALPAPSRFGTQKPLPPSASPTTPSIPDASVFVRRAQLDRLAQLQQEQARRRAGLPEHQAQPEQVRQRPDPYDVSDLV